MKIKKGDTVKIMAGKDRSKTGTVLKSMPSMNRLVVEGVNVYTKRVRAKQAGQKGETVQVPRPLNASRVALVCRNCKEAGRIGFRVSNESKERYCKKCGSPT